MNEPNHRIARYLRYITMFNKSGQQPTVVTAFVDLHKYEYRGKEKNINTYMENGRKLMNLDLPMVIFTEKENYHAIVEYRKSRGLWHKTIVIPINFMDEKDVPANKLRPRIEAIHKTKATMINKLPDYTAEVFSSPKNSVNYHILVYSKLSFLKQVAEGNPFNSDRLIWADFGITHVAKQHEEIMKWSGDIPERIRLLELYRFYTNGANIEDQYHHLEQGNGVAAGIITGSRNNFIALHDKFFDRVDDMLSNCYLFLEEAVLAFTMHKEPDLFDVYFGGFAAVCCNYQSPISIDIGERESLDRMFTSIRNSIINNDQKHAMRVINFIMPRIIQITEGVIQIPNTPSIITIDDIILFVQYYLFAKWYVEPIGYICDTMIDLVDKVVKNSKYKSVIDHIRNNNAIECYINKDTIKNIIDASELSYR